MTDAKEQRFSQEYTQASRIDRILMLIDAALDEASWTPTHTQEDS